MKFGSRVEIAYPKFAKIHCVLEGNLYFSCVVCTRCVSTKASDVYSIMSETFHRYDIGHLGVDH